MSLRSDEEKEQVRLRRVSSLERRWFRRRLISVFLVFHLCALVIWQLPPTSGLNIGLVNFVRPYMTLSDLSQTWNMFSPNPDSADNYLVANITLANNSVFTYEFPRIVKMGYAEKYRKERFRKFVEYARGNPQMWGPICDWLARKFQYKQPIKIQLVKYYRLIPVPGTAFGSFTQTILYVYDVRTGRGK